MTNVCRGCSPDGKCVGICLKCCYCGRDLTENQSTEFKGQRMTPIFHDEAYMKLLATILKHGISKGDRTGTGTLSRFGAQLRFDLREAFPLLTTKKLPLRWVAEELFWFLRGSTDESELRAQGVDIWKEWATEEQCARFGREEGDLGPIYGWQWRNFGAASSMYESGNNGFDQIAEALRLLRHSPDSRRVLVTGWNPTQATKVALPPCHTIYQFETHFESCDASPTGETRVLSCHMYQRSADVFLGVPFNIASYALLTHMFAYVLGYKVGDLVISFGDVHIYRNHMVQVEEQMSRPARKSPTLRIDADLSKGLPMLDRLLAIDWSHIKLEGYEPHPKISAPVAV